MGKPFSCHSVCLGYSVRFGGLLACYGALVQTDNATGQAYTVTPTLTHKNLQADTYTKNVNAIGQPYTAVGSY